ncbi:hypothetical protein [Nocardia ninae]|uniref:hypothetical protein n=1 Tax=Nocardia ninae TaxID=356145 RepID=UPI0011BFD5E1|nr:hypothetical protein [Nocardia ninae]
MTTIEVLTVPNCPNAPTTIGLLRTCLDRLDLNIPIQQRIGEYPSPTILGPTIGHGRAGRRSGADGRPPADRNRRGRAGVRQPGSAVCHANNRAEIRNL